MIKFTLLLCDIAIDVSCNFNCTKEFCKDFLTDKAPDFKVCVSAEDIEAEKQADSNHQFSDEYYESLALYRAIAEKLADYDVILYHSSAISVDGNGILFSAVSGVGKSTHAAIWNRVLPKLGHSVYYINDDKPLIIIKEGKPYVCGSPWNGAYRLSSNRIVPLKAICNLKRAKNNYIKKTDIKEAFPFMYAQTYKSRNISRLQRTLELIDMTAYNVKLFELGCNMDDEAATVAYNGIIKEISNEA